MYMYSKKINDAIYYQGKVTVNEIVFERFGCIWYKELGFEKSSNRF